MGYTHYFEHKAFTSEEITKVIPIIQAILTHCEVDIADGHGEQVGKYQCDDSLISFNGLGEDSHETFYVDLLTDVDFEFCKTAHKPYDPVVVLCLKVLDHYVPHFHWNSDGDYDPEERDAGAYALAKLLVEKQHIPELAQGI